MIVSASRRTDIPAFYSKWFMGRIREGYCLVLNPFNTKLATFVPMHPSDIDVVVFWSKNPQPLLEHLSELDERGYRYYFQFTLNDYPASLEPGVPSLEDRLSTFTRLVKHVGPLRVVWRYDPIILSDRTPHDFHIQRFTELAERLRGQTGRVMISIVDFYRKTERRLSRLEKEEDFKFERHPETLSGTAKLLGRMAEVARSNGMEIFSCAEERDFSSFGVRPGKCIDDDVMMRLWSLPLRYKKDPVQRDSCLCMVSKDIGCNDTCLHGCTYCYSTTSYAAASRRHAAHDPKSPLLWGDVNNVTITNSPDGPQARLPI